MYELGLMFVLCSLTVFDFHYLSLFTFVSVLLFVWFYRNSLWYRLAVPHEIPLPFVGNTLSKVLGTKTISDFQMSNGKRFFGYKFYGVYELSGPMLEVTDPDLIEQILIKDFEYFADRDCVMDSKNEPLFGNILFCLTGDLWRFMRKKLTPGFTATKLKTLHENVQGCTDKLLKAVDSNSKALDVSELMAKYSTNVISILAYGLDVDTLAGEENSFRHFGKAIFSLSTKTKIKSCLRQKFLSSYFDLIYFFKIPFIPYEVNDFFTDLYHKVVKSRENNMKYRRNDMVQMLLKIKNNGEPTKSESDKNPDYIVKNNMQSSFKENVDDSLLAAQCFVLFVAGVETTSFTLSYCLYELAHHREVQEELYDEISQVLKTNGGNLPYDELNNLKLLDMVISETLRKYPPLPDVNRICKTDYRIPDTNIVIPKGCRVQVPLYSLHRDPNVYPDPEKFDPKRFSPERKNSIPKGSFLPFGDGPRNCIGKRFALSEMKVCLSKFINAYKVDVTPGLCYPMEYDANSRFLLVAKKPIELKVLKRETI